MKESVAYNLAQCSVLDDKTLTATEKLIILRILMKAEDLALFTEEQDRKEGANK